MINNFDTTYLENALLAIVRTCNLVTGVYTNRPKAKTSEDSFVVVNVGGNIEDEDCYAKCRVYVSMYTKDLADMKNGKKLSVMYQRLIAGFPASYKYQESQVTKGEYLFGNPTIVGDKADDFGFHCRVVQFETTIKVI